MTKNELNNWRLNSLETLENEVWSDSLEYPSTLIKRCHELRKIPVDQLTIEDLRLLIGQNIGLEYLIPISIDVLRLNILAEGDFYPGDLLQNVLNVDRTFWDENENYKNQIVELVKQNFDKIKAEGIKFDIFDTHDNVN